MCIRDRYTSVQIHKYSNAPWGPPSTCVSLFKPSYLRYFLSCFQQILKPTRIKSELLLDTTITLKRYSTITIMYAPINIPLLLAFPPTINAAQIRKVDHIGLMKSGQTAVFNHAQSTPPNAAIPAPNARLAALCESIL